MGNKKMVCPCLKVYRDDIVEAIDNGASNFKDVKKKTKIVTKCGKCKTRARCLVREIFAEKDLLIEGEEGVCLGCQGDFFEPEDDHVSDITVEKKDCAEAKKHKKAKQKHKKEKKPKEKNSGHKEKKAKEEDAGNHKKKAKKKNSDYKEQKKLEKNKEKSKKKKKKRNKR